MYNHIYHHLFVNIGEELQAIIRLETELALCHIRRRTCCEVCIVGEQDNTKT